MIFYGNIILSVEALGTALQIGLNGVMSKSSFLLHMWDIAPTRN